MTYIPARERYTITVVATGTAVDSPHDSMLARAPRNESSPGIPSVVAAPDRDGGDDTRATRATDKI